MDRVAVISLVLAMGGAGALLITFVARPEAVTTDGGRIVTLVCICAFGLPPCGLALYRVFDDSGRSVGERLRRVALFLLLGPLAAALVLRERISRADDDARSSHPAGSGVSFRVRRAGPT